VTAKEKEIVIYTYMPASTPKVLKLFAYDWMDKRVNEKNW